MNFKSIIIIGLLVLIAVIFFSKPSISEDNTITTDKVKKLLDEKADIFILDVRSQREYNDAHIKGVVLIPLGELKDNLDKIPKDKDVVALCAVGGRSGSATKFLLDNGFTRVYNMLGGMKEWQKKGFPVE